MRTIHDIGIELRTRNVQMRQFLGMSRFDIWADDRCHGSFVTQLEAETCIRNLLRVTPEEGAMLDSYVQQFVRGQVGPEAN